MAFKAGASRLPCSGERERRHGAVLWRQSGLVLVRLVILSLVVGVVLAALGFSPFDIIDSLRALAQRIYDLGWTAVEKAGRYFLLGAVIVFPVWFVVRLLKMLGAADNSDATRNRA